MRKYISIDIAFQEAADRKHIPGAVVTAANSPDIIHQNAFGKRSLSTNVNMAMNSNC